MTLSLQCATRAILTALGAMMLLAGPAVAQAPLAAPPRSINDINSVLDQEKTDPSRAARARAAADAQPEAGLEARAQAQFLFRRAQARASLGRNRDAIADAEQAVTLGNQVMAGMQRPPQANQYYFQELSRYQQFLSIQYRAIGDAKRSIEMDQAISEKFEQIGRFKGRFFSSNLRTIMAYIQLGDLAQAEAFSAKNAALLEEAKSWKNFDVQGVYFTAVVEEGKARVAAARGRARDAELAYHKAQDLYRTTIDKLPSWPPQSTPPNKIGLESQIDFLLSYEGSQKRQQGRLSEAEADIRAALLSRLKAVGKYSPELPQIMTALAIVLSEQRRQKEAEQLDRAAIDIFQNLGYQPSVPTYAQAIFLLAGNLFNQARYDEASEVFATLDEAIKDWPPERAAGMRLSWSRIFTALMANRTEEAVTLARQLVEFRAKRLGEGHIETATAHGILAAALTAARFRNQQDNNRDAEALKEFQIAMPVLLGNARDTEDDDIAVSSAADSRQQFIVEHYLLVLARNRRAIPNVESESFALGEAIRRRSVEKALSASSARAVARDPALADLVRKEQDLQKEIGAQLGALNNMLGTPASERDDKAVAALRSDIEKMRTARTAARADIEKKFPGYADLVSPKSATVEDMRAVLRPGEAMISLYFGQRGSLMWAIPKEGPVAFASTRMTARDLDKKVNVLREALEPQAAMVSDIPPFDVALASEIYNEVLKPIEGGWKSAKNLIVVTNGALGLLPLGLLPTANVTVKTDAEPYFSGYRDVPWLARTHAVTTVPSAAAFRTLRKLPASRPNRDKLIAFGDPLFNADQAAEAKTGGAVPAQVAQTTMRGLPLKLRAAPQLNDKESVTIAALPRLPDTADELRSIALALEADPSRVVNLGLKANEQTVKTMDLSKYKILVFATHGLVPGELSGLTQPALALSAPDVAGVDGDGLLTMEEILALKLDADWVVLSACNTGTSASTGAGAEAASGLGRAFFYAGTRALLVTNWSVHSASARELVSDLFRRQAKDAAITRGEALRQAMTAMIDGPGFKDDKGHTLFAYAHPLFWAPYTIIGDGGGN